MKRPPSKDELPGSPYTYLVETFPGQVREYIQFYSPVDSKGRYLPFDEFRYRVPKGIEVNLAWSLTKMARGSNFHAHVYIDEFKTRCPFALTTMIQKAATMVDQNATSSALQWAIGQIGEEEHFRYFLNDLIEDESISSSQLEGAATTTLVAKDMLKRKREPRSIDERMILGNFRMMKFVWETRHQPLSIELIKKLHSVGVSGIEDAKYLPGEFRLGDDVVVADAEGNVIHQPPLAERLDVRLGYFCDWVNKEHDNLDSSEYIHPLVKAVIIHFMIGFEHPFRDGNGRVARALFYWFMFKKDYGAFRYISISNLLKDAATQYGKSYIYTETDEMDLTYFIEYQASIVMRAVATFKEHCKKVITDIESFNKWLWDSGVYRKLSDKQKTIFQVAKNKLSESFTASSVKENLNCSYNTAASALNGLVELQLFDKNKVGKEWIYVLRDKQDIQKNWHE